MTGHEEQGQERRGLEGWVLAVRDTAARDESFWARQRGSIGRRIAPSRIPSWGWVAGLGMASVAVTALAILVARGPDPVQVPSPMFAVSTAGANVDDQWLMDVERAVLREVPLAFEEVDFLMPGARDPDVE